MNILNISRMVCVGAILNLIITTTASAALQLDEKIMVPDVSLKNVTGETANLKTFIGNKPVLLVFWASWCTNCREEISQLNKLNAGGFKVIAVNEGESVWKTKRFISANKIDYQIALDTDGAIAKSLQVPGVPACVVLNKSGVVVFKGIGLPENIESYAVK